MEPPRPTDDNDLCLRVNFSLTGYDIGDGLCLESLPIKGEYVERLLTGLDLPVGPARAAHKVRVRQSAADLPALSRPVATEPKGPAPAACRMGLELIRWGPSVKLLDRMTPARHQCQHASGSFPSERWIHERQL